jgi:hypothetical protein
MRIEAQLEKVVQLFMQVAPGIRLLQTKGQEDVVGYFGLICDGYGETRVPMLGKLLDAMRAVGNLIAFVASIEVEIEAGPANLVLLGAVMKVFQSTVAEHKELFVANEFDYEKVLNHRSFPALWCVLEFLLCSPNPVQLSDTVTEKFPLDKFGTGPVICGHMLIIMAGQKALYQYDAIVGKSIELWQVQNVPGKTDLKTYLLHAVHVEHAREWTELIAHPFRKMALS